MAHKIRFYDGLDGGAYTGRWTLQLDPFTWPVGMGDDFIGLDLVVEDPTDPDYLYDAYIYSTIARAKELLTGGLWFDSDDPPAWADDDIAVSRYSKADWIGLYGLTFPEGTLWDPDWNSYEWDVVEEDPTLEAPWATTADLRPIEVQVFEPNGATLDYLDELTSDVGRTFLDDLPDAGSHTLEVKAGHDDEALLGDGRLVRYFVHNQPRWWGLIEDRSKVSADPEKRQEGRVVRVKTGRGALAVLEQAPIYPELGLGRISPTTRYMNFASLDYDDTAWGFAVELKQQSDPALPWRDAPKAWPDPDAWWVGPSAGDVPPVAPGDIYLRGTFTVGAGLGGEWRFFLTADDGFELYVDGNKEAAEQKAGLWGVTRSVTLILDEGEHLVAVKAINFDRPNPSTNVFGFILSVRRLLGGGQSLGPVVARSSAGTKMLAYPTSAPGMTAGKILIVFLTEAQAAGYLPYVTWDFDEVNDSAGTPWPVELDLAFPVGSTTILDVARRLIVERACDLNFDPATATTLKLQAWVTKGTDLTDDVTIDYGVNIGKLGHDHKGPGPNTILSRTAEGRYYETERTASVTAWGRRGAFLSLGSAPSDLAAERQSQAFLDDEAEPADIITEVRMETTPGDPVPFEDFNKGDRVLAPGFDGDLAPFWVTGILVGETEEGEPTYDLNLETP